LKRNTVLVKIYRKTKKSKDVESKKAEIEEIQKLTKEEWYKQDLMALKKSLLTK
jgi:hypothetical protein